jgi:hypothetical protein
MRGPVRIRRILEFVSVIPPALLVSSHNTYR